MQYYLLAAAILHVLTVVSLLCSAGVSIAGFMEDVAWNQNLTLMGQLTRREIIVNAKSDLAFSLTRPVSAQSNDEKLFRLALKSSDLKKIVGRKSEYQKLSIRQIGLQVLFIAVVIILAITSMLHFIVLLRLKTHARRSKVSTIYHLVGAGVLLVVYYLFIYTFITTDHNYKRMGGRIREVALVIANLRDSEAIPETFHNCQLRAMGIPLDNKTEADLRRRMICQARHFKLSTLFVTFGCLLLFLLIPCYICTCLRRKQREGKVFLEPEGENERIDPGSRKSAHDWLLAPQYGIGKEGSDGSLTGFVFTAPPGQVPIAAISTVE